jgi:DNA (cytosine-5)-methyltransferase 1
MSSTPTETIHGSDVARRYPRPTMWPVIDLFAGAGGFGIAAQGAGADLRLSVELDPVAVGTLKENASLGHNVVEADLSECSGADLRHWARLDRRDPLLIVGGAPCQPFSKAAYWVEAGDDAAWRRDRANGVKRPRPAAPTAARPDDRRTLVEHFARLVIEADADGFVFENVPAIQHPRNRPVLEGLLAEVSAAGFKTTVVKALASNYGVAQHRERVFVMGSRSVAPAVPDATHDGRSEGLDGLLPAVTAGAVCAPYASDAYFEPEEVVTGRWAEHLAEIPPGWNYKHHTAWAGHPNPTFVTERRFWNFLLVLDPALPSWTIPANPGPWVGPFHWDHRRLRMPELAAIQGFPHGYIFCGTRRERVRQVGNAVPPLLAAPMIRSVLASLERTLQATA